MRGKSGTESSTNGKRKRWTSKEKLRIVLAGLEGGAEISELCRREGLNPTMYYSWKRALLGAADRVFDTRTAKPSAREQRLESNLRRAKDVIAEITSENLDLKKTFSD